MRGDGNGPTIVDRVERRGYLGADACAEYALLAPIKFEEFPEAEWSAPGV